MSQIQQVVNGKLDMKRLLFHLSEDFNVAVQDAEHVSTLHQLCSLLLITVDTSLEKASIGFLNEIPVETTLYVPQNITFILIFRSGIVNMEERFCT